MSEWQECRLGEIAEIQTGPFGSQLKNKQYITGGTPVVTVEHISNFRINNFSYPSVTDEDKNRLSRYLLNEGDIIFTRVGSVDLSAFVKPHQQGWMFSSRMLRVRPEKKVDARFLSYFFQQKPFRDYVLSIAVGATMPSINTEILKSLPISYPDLSEQKAIASVLSSLDDKIDLLHRQNKTLEAMAETLFRQWFVEEAGEDWEEALITELFEVRDGTHDSPKQSIVGRPLITSKHILDGQLDIANAYLISENDFNKINQRSKVDTGDILFSMIGTIGLIYFEQSLLIDYAIKNIGLFKTSQNPDWAIFTFLWLKSPIGRQFIDEHKSGSTQEYVALGSMRSIVFQKPPIEILKKFNKLVSSYFAKIKLNHTQIHTLGTLRNTLLPKLMSVEVRVAV
ncbi:MAG: restriction endonuclease subunit S [Nitrosomonas sp.]|uniref:restriction endonuclease subunit S n=1 Tax=Nitrosomonas sp. TaxID=42353 RepID=UPI0027349080|nr:restriction endonuclease subunit S [Nitrosomonas sp.]MDP3281323.1 restriction endonuclease subunit S [Nitrosomonas sp.]MDP3662291.1 restriction endonuclease subunit S [Nitrosomonas sp.]MDZ4105846.1 restriction endonuclease subunit S [Nitrosomonas sp.]